MDSSKVIELQDPTTYKDWSYEDLATLHSVLSSLMAKKKGAEIEALQNKLKLLGVTPDDLKASEGAKKNGKRGPVAPKYRNPETGDTWTGRGRKPAWVVAQLEAGKTMEDLRIQ